MSASRRKELGLRLLSAAVLVPFGVFVVWHGGLILTIGCALFAAILTYEWVRMTNSPAMIVMVGLAIIPSFVTGFTGLFYGVGALLACAIVAWFAHPLKSERLKSGLGLFYTAGMPLALLALRMEPAWNGMVMALTLMSLVWVSDSAAFFSGRTFGGPSLTSLSPSKTWSGAIGGVILSAIGGIVAALILDLNLFAWAVTGGLISVAAQLGDLFESAQKRQLGVKDASKLVPGHGGVMDRVDGLGFAAAVAVVAMLVLPNVVRILGVEA